MKLLTALITPGKLDSVTGAIEAAAFEVMMVTSAQTPSQSRPGLTYRGVRYADPTVVRVELLVDSDDAERAAHVISEANDRGAGEGDGVRMWAIDALRPLGRPAAHRDGAAPTGRPHAVKTIVVGIDDEGLSDVLLRAAGRATAENARDEGAPAFR